MAIVPRGLVHQGELSEAIEKARLDLATEVPEVVRVRYSLDRDWTGDPSIFFRVLLRDEASKTPRLGRVARRVIDRVSEKVRPEAFGLNSYFNFRSESEQAKLNEADWAQEWRWPTICSSKRCT
jgi:hypothetical protein